MDKTENIESRPRNPRSPSRDDDNTTLPLVTGDDDTTLWLVSFDDSDDRELRAPQIAEALVRGDIDRDTIVWREGLTDWLPIANVPALARLLPASGATANAPLVVPTPSGDLPTAKLPEAKGPLEQASEKALAKGAAFDKAEAKSDEPETKSDKAEVKNDKAEAPRPPPMIKGTTKIGLPRVDSAKPLPKAPERTSLFQKAGSKSADQTPLPKGAPKPPSADQTPLPPGLASKAADPTPSPSKFTTKSAEQTPLPGKTLPKAPDRTPLPGKTLPKAPDRTPLPGRPPVPGARAAAKTESAKPSLGESPSSPRAKMNSNPDIWGAPGEEEEEAPISIEPESMRPPTPTDTRAINRATALSPGILAVKKPKAPPARPQAERPAAKEPTPEKEESAPDSAGTPSLNSLAHLPPTTNPVDEEILRLVGGDLGPPVLSGPTIEVPDVTPSREPTPLLAAPFDLGALTREAPSDDIPIEISKSEPPKKAALAETKTGKPVVSGSVAKASSPAPDSKPKKRPIGLIVLGAAALAAIALYSMREKPAPEPPAEPARTAQPEAPAPATAAAPPQTAEATAEPAAPAAPAASTPEAPSTPSHVKSTDTKEPSGAKTTESSAAPSKTATSSSKADTAPKTEAAPAKEAKAEPPPPPQKEVDVDAEFDKGAASAALGSAAQQASSCRKPGDPTGVATVHVTFSNAGRATRAVVEGPPFAGTATGGCIADILRKAKVPPYGGDRVTVTKRVVIQ